MSSLVGCWLLGGQFFMWNNIFEMSKFALCLNYATLIHDGLVWDSETYMLYRMYMGLSKISSTAKDLNEYCQVLIHIRCCSG